MRILKALSLALLIASVFSSLSFAAQQDRISGSLSSGENHVLKGNIRHQARPEFDQGRVDPGMQLGTITLQTAPTAAQESAIKLLLAQQQDRKSPNYHKWLTPEQYADRFGLSENDMQKMVAWLAAQGFTMIEPARGRNFITFTGTAAQVESVFGTEIHHYNVKGEVHYANATAPQIPAALAGIVVGMHGLDDFRLKAMNVKSARPNYYSSALQSQFIAPGDIYTMYDINPLLTATPKIDGTGQKVGIVGQTEIFQSDINDFRTNFGLSSISCTAGTIPNDIITACNDPHFSYIAANGGPTQVSGNDIGEADLDLEWSGAIAPGAQIVFVTSGDVFNSLYYAIDNKVAPVISMSYGNCEFNLNISEFSAPSYSVLFEGELQAANLAGITVVNSSGDSGAAECDGNGVPAQGGTMTTTGLAQNGLGVAYPASSPEVTGVGGTAIQLADLGSPTYWGTTNGTNGGSVLSYIPEQTWNDGDEFVTYCQQNPGAFCTQGGATKQDGITGLPWVPITSEATAQEDIGIGSDGGGASSCAVQNADFSACVSGFPQPDWQTVTVSGQTTRLSPDISLLATPNFPGFIYCTPIDVTGGGSTCGSGIPTAVSQYFSLIGGTSASAPMFAGMVALLNQYTASTGQGNINVPLYQLAKSTPSAFHDVTSGDNNVACLAGSPGTPQLQSLWCPSTGPSTGVVGYSAGAGFDLATGLGSVDVNNLAVALFSLTSPFTLAPTSASFQVTQGNSVNATVTVTINGSFTGTITFTCNDPAPESICTVPTPVTAASLPANGQVSFNISTTAPTASLRSPDRGARIFYAALLPGLFGLMLTGGARRRSLRGMRFLGFRILGLILVMGFSTMWLASCGGSSGGNSNPGTPVNNYTITVGATSGGATVSAPSFSLDVVQ